MKVISGGIPGRPQHTTGAGDLYSKLHKIAYARAIQLEDTDQLTSSLGEEIKAKVVSNYKALNDKLSEHIAKEGPQHGETLKSLGLSMVNDFPLTHWSHIVEGEVYNEYVTPKTLNDALHQVDYGIVPDLLGVGRFNLNYVDSLRGMGNWIWNSGESGGTQAWERGSVIGYLGGCAYLGYPIRGSSTSLLIDAYPGAKQVQGLRQVGSLFGPNTLNAYGWNAIGYVETSSWKPPVFVNFQSFPFGEEYGAAMHDQGDVTATANHLTWLDPNIDSDCFGGVISANLNGIRFGLVNTKPAVQKYNVGINGSNFFGWGCDIIQDPNVFKYTFEGNTSTDKLISVPWETLTGKTGIVFDHVGEVHGGFEWIERGRELFIFLSVNLSDADGNKHTAFFGWVANLRNLKAVTITRLNTPFDWSTSAVPSLPTEHPFHPVNGAGLLRTQGGHSNIYTHNMTSMVLEHVHEISSLKEVYDRCLELPDLPVATELRLNIGMAPMHLGSAQGRMFLMNDHTMVNGQFNGSGEWTFYRQEWHDGMFWTGSTHLPWKPPSATRLISEFKEFNQECVNTINSNGEVQLTGLVWSTENLHEAIGTVRGVVGKGMMGKVAHLTESSRTAIEKDHKAFLVDNDYNAYACVMVYPVGNDYQGLGMRCDQQGNVEVAKLEVSKVGDDYQVSKVGDYQNIYQSEGPVNGPGNLRRFLKRDFYVHLNGNDVPKITIKHPLMDRTLILRIAVGPTFTVEETYAPEPNEVGLTLFHIVMPTTYGPMMPVPGGLSGFYRLGDYSVDGSHVAYPDRYVYLANPNDTVTIKGRNYAIPPGFSWNYESSSKANCSFTLKDGELYPLGTAQEVNGGLHYEKP
ncbi:hypothetical protein [Vibrio phage phiKT1019]|nr:hypothetical protein [Vibrio phage phiKT1019]